MQEETEVLGENLRRQVWIKNQIHIWLWPDWESNPGHIGERHGNIPCANPPMTVNLMVRPQRPLFMSTLFNFMHQNCLKSVFYSYLYTENFYH